MKTISILCLILAVCVNVFAQSKLANKVANGGLEYSTSEINRLKDAVINQKTQLKLFRQLILNEGIQTAYPKIQFTFTNKLSDRYRIFSVSYFIDGIRSYSFVNDNISDPTKESKLPNAFWHSIAPGRHTIKVIVSYMGNDTGIFSYLADYKINMETLEDFSFQRGQNVNVNITAFEKGGIFTDFKEKAQIKLDIKNHSSREVARQ